MSSVLIASVLLAASVPRTFVDDADYLRRKWQEDVTDPSTGMDLPSAGRVFAKQVPEWKKEMSWPAVKAKMVAFLCDNVSIDVSEHDWFPAFAPWSRDFERKNRVRGRCPVLDQVWKRDREVTSKFMPKVCCGERGSWWMYRDFDHSAPCWEDILKLGFPGMLKRLEANWKDDEFHRVRKTAGEAVLRLLDRLIAQGDAVRGRAAGGRRLEKTVASLKRLRAGAPQTALDAMNFIYLYWAVSEMFESIQVRTLGNIDRLLTPYCRADLAAGRTTEAEFRDQFTHFWWQWGSMDYYWGQPVFVGGTEADGSSVYNEVSKTILDIVDELALPTPKLHLKMGRSTPDWVWTKTLDMMRRQRSVTFVGEEPHWRVIRSMGYAEEEAREFIIWGCYEWAIRDSANDTCGATVSLLKPVEALLAEAASDRFDAPTFDGFKAAYRERIVKTLVTACDGACVNEKYLADVNPALLFSLATAYSVETGRDPFAGGMRRGNNSSIWTIGLGTTVDALLAVKELVYEKKEMSLAELGRLMAANWKGREDLRQRMLRSKRKWGNDDPDANALAVEVSKCIAKPVNGRPNARGGVFKVMGHSARRHYDMGRALGATPDGRLAGEEFSKNVSPTMGADTEGVTALLNSAAVLDARDFPGDFPLDVGLVASSIPGEKGLRVARAFVESYFARGGLVIQFNVADAATLRDAQKHPEKHANLQVRVCGWNVRWNDIPPAEQEAFIRRAENLNGL